VSARLKPAASLEEIARAEGISIGATRMLLTRALRKLRREGLLTTARALAAELERNRNSEHSVYRRNGRRAGAE
jgi:hypothetical protein